ncbi:MAG: anaerobic ribonucleoside-triphosphate reductase [Collinsella aerofaciens]
MLLPAEIVEAHNEGIIHFHDSDYSSTCTTATRESRGHAAERHGHLRHAHRAPIASPPLAHRHADHRPGRLCQHGGQSISLTHLAPFVEVSRQKIRRQVDAELKDSGSRRLRRRSPRSRPACATRFAVAFRPSSIRVVTLTTNGQAPFVTVFMYLNEARSEAEKRDLAMIIEETLRQRYEGEERGGRVDHLRSWLSTSSRRTTSTRAPSTFT